MSTSIEKIKTKYLEDEKLKELKEKVVNCKAEENNLDANSTRWVKGNICVP